MPFQDQDCHWQEAQVTGALRESEKYSFFDLSSKVNSVGSQAEQSGLCFLTALIGVPVSLCVQIQHDHNPLTSQAGTIPEHYHRELG